MIPTLAISLVLLAPASGDPTVPVDDLKAKYQAARAEARRDPEAQIRLALWCEQHGLSAERLHLLALVVLADPSNARARGLMGLVPYRGRWQNPEAVADRVKADSDLAASLARYNSRREKAPNTAEGQWQLAIWCERNGLGPEATAHFTAVTRLDPKREAAWKRLGCKRHQGRWLNDAAIAAEKAEAEAQEEADRRWKPLLESWKARLGRPEKRADAERDLLEIVDPRAVPSIWSVFGQDDQRRAVRLLGQVDAPSASRLLAALAVSGLSEEVRREASETLRRRDPHEFASMLIALFRDPARFEVRPVAGPGSPGVLYVEGERFDVRRFYSPPSPNVQVAGPYAMTTDENGLPVMVVGGGVTRTVTPYAEGVRQLQAGIDGDHRVERQVDEAAQAAGGSQAAQAAQSLNHMIEGIANQQQAMINQATQAHAHVGKGGHVTAADFVTDTPVSVQVPVGQMMVEARKVAAAAQKQLEADVKRVESANDEVRASNRRIAAILRDVTGRDLGPDREAWKRWLVELKGYAYVPAPRRPRPMVDEEVPLEVQPLPVRLTSAGGPSNTALGASAPASSTFHFVNNDFLTQTHHHCFAAGTTVRTLSGPRPIESIRAGDRVLSQDPKTGTLDFRPVVVAYHNPPNATLRVDLGGEAIVATPIHRFWRAGKGWTMARDLKVGDPIRTLDGTVRVASVAAEKVQPVFNLELSEGCSFFVGRAGALVHDNSTIRPTPEAFDDPDGPALSVAEAH